MTYHSTLAGGCWGCKTLLQTLNESTLVIQAYTSTARHRKPRGEGSNHPRKRRDTKKTSHRLMRQTE